MGLTKADIYKTLFLSTVISAAPAVATFSQDKSDKKDCVPTEELITPNSLDAWDKTVVKDFTINQYDKDNNLITSEHFKEYSNWGVDIIKSDATLVEIAGDQQSYGNHPGSAHFAYRPLDDQGKATTDSYYLISDWRNIDADIFKPGTLYEVVEFSTKGYADLSNILNVHFVWEDNCYKAVFDGETGSKIEILTASTVGRAYREIKGNEFVPPPLPDPSEEVDGKPDTSPPREIKEPAPQVTVTDSTDTQPEIDEPSRFSWNHAPPGLHGVHAGYFYDTQEVPHSDLSFEGHGFVGVVDLPIAYEMMEDTKLLLTLEGMARYSPGDKYSFDLDGKRIATSSNALFAGGSGKLGVGFGNFQLEGGAKGYVTDQKNSYSGINSHIHSHQLGPNIRASYSMFDDHLTFGVELEKLDGKTKAGDREQEHSSKGLDIYVGGYHGIISWELAGGIESAKNHTHPNLHEERKILSGEIAIANDIALRLKAQYFWIGDNNHGFMAYATVGWSPGGK